MKAFSLDIMLQLSLKKYFEVFIFIGSLTSYDLIIKLSVRKYILYFIISNNNDEDDA